MMILSLKVVSLFISRAIQLVVDGVFRFPLFLRHVTRLGPFMVLLTDKPLFESHNKVLCFSLFMGSSWGDLRNCF